MSAGSTIVAPCCFITAIAVASAQLYPVVRALVAERTLRDDADARAAQAVRVERRACSRRADLRCASVVVVAVVARSSAGERAEQNRGVGDGARHRAGGVLAVRDRNDAGAADRPSVGLMPTSAAAVDGRHDRAVGLRADCRRGEVRRDRGAGSGARSGRVAVERVRIPRLPAASAPAARRMRRAEVRPLAEIRLAEDDRAGLRAAASATNASRGGDRVRPARASPAVVIIVIGGGDVVLDQDRDAVQRAARARLFRSASS